MFGTLILRDFFWNLLKFLGVTRVLDSGTISKICYKLFWMYIDTKKVAEISFVLESPIERPRKGPEKRPKGIEDLTGLFFLLKAMEIALKSLDRATITRLLWECPHF